MLKLGIFRLLHPIDFEAKNNNVNAFALLTAYFCAAFMFAQLYNQAPTLHQLTPKYSSILNDSLLAFKGN